MNELDVGLRRAIRLARCVVGYFKRQGSVRAVDKKVSCAVLVFYCTFSFFDIPRLKIHHSNNAINEKVYFI